MTDQEMNRLLSDAEPPREPPEQPEPPNPTQMEREDIFCKGFVVGVMFGCILGIIIPLIFDCAGSPPEKLMLPKPAEARSN